MPRSASQGTNDKLAYLDTQPDPDFPANQRCPDQCGITLLVRALVPAVAGLRPFCVSSEALIDRTLAAANVPVRRSATDTHDLAHPAQADVAIARDLRWIDPGAKLGFMRSGSNGNRDAQAGFTCLARCNRTERDR